MHIFEQTWFSIDTKMMRNFVQKIYYFIETLSLNKTPKKTLNISGPFNFYFYLGFNKETTEAFMNEPIL